MKGIEELRQFWFSDDGEPYLKTRYLQGWIKVSIWKSLKITQIFLEFGRPVEEGRKTRFWPDAPCEISHIQISEQHMNIWIHLEGQVDRISHFSIIFLVGFIQKIFLWLQVFYALLHPPCACTLIAHGSNGWLIRLGTVAAMGLTAQRKESWTHHLENSRKKKSPRHEENGNCNCQECGNSPSLSAAAVTVEEQKLTGPCDTSINCIFSAITSRDI